MMKKLLAVLAIAVLLIAIPVSATPAWTSANGCWTVINGTDTIVKFNATGNFSYQIPTGVSTVWITLIGAGSGGATGHVGGGGAAGGFINKTIPVPPGTTVFGWIGQGGNGGADGAYTNAPSRGGSSHFYTEDAYGGGPGGMYNNGAGQDGASGGGGAYATGAAGTGITSPFQGNNGGTGNGANPGGAGGAGEAGNTDGQGYGGDGNVSKITGETDLYAGGGAAGHVDGASRFPGGDGGGGDGGANGLASRGINGTDEKGGGGGGGGLNGGVIYGGGNGGSGVLYIRFATPASGVVANYTASQLSGVYPFTSTFTSDSTGSPITYNWSVNGVVEATTQNYTRLFNNGGNFTVNLTVTATGSTSTASKVITVFNQTVGGFAANVTSGARPLVVKFTDSSSNATSWYYEFGDGNTSTSQSPTFTYNIAGVYSVNQRVTNSANVTWYNRTNYITVSDGLYAITANFTATNQTGQIPLLVVLEDASTYFNSTPATYYWDFGDGTNSTSRNETHTFTTAGAYSVNYTVTNATEGISSSKIMIFTATSPAGFNQQDIVMDPLFTFIIHITESSTGVPILIASVTDASTGTIYTTTNGTVIIQTPYTTLAGWIQASGYDAQSFSKVIDEDMTETYALTKSATSNSSQIQYSASHNVKILVKDAWKGPIEGVNVTATYVEASGPFDWLFAWIGVISNPGANVQNTTLYGHTGTDGAINFLMVESVQYNITATKPGIISKSMLIYPKDDDYTIWTQEMNSSFLYESGYNELEEVQVAVNGTEVNQTYGKIMVTYYDHLDKTNFVFITVNQSVVSGNSTVEHSVSNVTVTGDSDFTSTLYIANSRDQSYLVHVLPNHTIFGNMSRDFGVTFPPGPISLGLPENLLHLIGMGLLFFIVLCFVRSLPGETVIVVTFFAWVFFFMRWWTQMAQYYIVLGALIGMTVFAIVYNIVLRSKKVILS